MRAASHAGLLREGKCVRVISLHPCKVKQVPRLFSPEDVGQREAAQLAGSQAGGLEHGLRLCSSAALLPGVTPGLLLTHAPAQALKPHAALGKRTFLQTWAADPGPIPATRLGPQGVCCFRGKKAVKQLCLHVFTKVTLRF